jgi:hypothetical protein
MPWNEGVKTFKAGEDLEARRRVKIESGTTNDPPEIVYADAGEDFIGVTEYAVSDGDLVAVKLNSAPGTFEVECVIDSAISRGTVLYGAADGKVSDAVSGTAQGISLEAPGADNQHIEVAFWNVKSTTAATVSVADTGSLLTGATVEAVLAELATHLLSAQKFIPIPLTSLMEGDASNTVAFLGPATTPVLDMANGDTDSGLVVTWEASNSDPVLINTPLPPDMDVTEDLVLHLRAKSGGSTDTPTIASDAYFNEGDTKVEDVSAALGASVAELTITIAAADIPAGAQTLTVELTPGAHTTDTVVISAAWLEYTGKILTA